MKHSILNLVGLFTFILMVPSGNAVVATADSVPAAAPQPSLVRLSYPHLVAVREQLAAKNTAISDAVAQLDMQAKKLLDIKPFTIVNKKVLPASGNPHDYFSFAPYWWPNPATPDGMPWIQLDGKINPASRDKFSDKVAFNGMVNATQTLSNAYFFTRNPPYAQKTAELIRVWFLDEKTKMNPHLRYAQAIPGSFTGRGIGIIDTRLLYRVLDSILLVESAGVFTQQESAGLKQWFAEYLDWLIHSPLGIDERKTTNNHGTFYDFQVAAIAVYVGRTDIVRDTIARTKGRINEHFDKQGKQPFELARTRPFHYSVFNMQAYFGIAHIAQGQNINLWDYPDKKKSTLKQGMNYLLTRMQQEKNWGGKEELKIEEHIMVPLLLEFSQNSEFSIAQYIGMAPESSQWAQCMLLLNIPKVPNLTATATDVFEPCFY